MKNLAIWNTEQLSFRAVSGLLELGKIIRERISQRDWRNITKHELEELDYHNNTHTTLP